MAEFCATMCRVNFFLLLVAMLGSCSAMKYVYIGYVEAALKPPVLVIGNLTVIPRDVGRIASADYPISVSRQKEIYDELKRLAASSTRLVAIVHTCNFNLMLAASRASIAYFLINDKRRTCDTWEKFTNNVFKMNLDFELRAKTTRSLLKLYRIKELIVITDFGEESNIYFPQLQDEYSTIGALTANATSAELQSVMLNSQAKLRGTSINVLLLIDNKNTSLFTHLLDTGLFTGTLVPKSQWFLPTYPHPLNTLEKYKYSGASIFKMREEVAGISFEDRNNLTRLVNLSTTFIANAIRENTGSALPLLKKGKLSTANGILSFDPTTGDLMNEKIIVSMIQKRKLITKKYIWKDERLSVSSLDQIDENDWRIAVIQNSIFFNITETGQPAGFAIDLIRQFAVVVPELNFTFIMPSNPTYHKTDVDSMYGVIYDFLVKGEADVAFVPIPTIASWHESLDYASPSFGEVGVNMLMAKQNQTIIQRMLWYMTAPFTFNVWIGCGIVYILLVFVLWVTDKISPNYVTSESLGVTDSLFLVSAAFMMAKLDVRPRMLSVRIFNLLLWFATLVMMASYAANLFQYILNKPPYIPINTLTDAFQFGSSYPWFWINSRFSYGFFENRVTSYPDSLEAEMILKANRSWPSTMLVPNMSEVYPRLRGSSQIFIGNSMTNLFMTMYHCDLQTAGLLRNVFPIAFPMRKNWNGKQLFDSAYLTLEKNTILRQLKQKYFTFNPCRGTTNTVTIHPMDVFDVAGIFMLLAAGIVIAAIAGIIEFIVKKIDLSCQRLTGGGLQFGKTYNMKVLFLEPDGVRVAIVGQKRQYFVPAKLLHPSEQREISPADLGIQVGTKLKLKYNGNDLKTGERVFKRVS